MSSPEIVEKKPITIAHVKSLLKAIKKRDEELSYRGNKAEEYANLVCSTTKKLAEELHKAITELNIPRLKEEHIIKIIDTLPSSAAELKIVLQGYTLTVSNDNINKIMKVLNDNVPKK